MSYLVFLMIWQTCTYKGKTPAMFCLQSPFLFSFYWGIRWSLTFYWYWGKGWLYLFPWFIIISGGRFVRDQFFFSSLGYIEFPFDLWFYRKEKGSLQVIISLNFSWLWFGSFLEDYHGLILIVFPFVSSPFEAVRFFWYDPIILK